MKLIRNLWLTAVASVLVSGAAFAGDTDFTLVNRTGYTLREVYVSPSHKANWGSDRMGEGYLDNNRSRLFKFSSKNACMQDIKVVFDDDASEIIWEDFNLCELDKITLRYNRKTNEVSADTE